MINEENKVKISNKIYPYFSGFSSDLLFWVAINTMFLTIVKGFSASEISSFNTISVLISLVSYPIILKIIKKIGNINSIRLGTIMLLISAVLFTFTEKYYLILLGYIVYSIAFIFTNMSNVILKNNLKYENKQDEYIHIQSKGSLIYSSLTMIIAFIAGFLFNINNYLPMYLCILCCIISIVLSNFLYEHKEKKVQEVSKDIKFSLTKIIFYIFLLYALVYATIDLGQTNTKLYIQYKLSSFLEISQVSIAFSIIIAISRIARVISNFLFTKMCKRNKGKILYFINFLLIVSFILTIIGGIFKANIFGVIIMLIGFFIFLGVRDPFANYMKALLMNNVDEQSNEKAITYLNLSRKLGNFLVSSMITFILLKVDIVYSIILLLIVAIINIVVIEKMYKLMEKD